ncbi:MAG: tautomerase family protein [Stellaceae bacterium]
MPLTRIDLRRGKSAEYRRAIMDQVYAAMRETFEVPDEDRFMLLTEHDADTMSYSRRYLGIERSDDLVVIQITVSKTRTVEQKKALYQSVARHLAVSPGIRPADVFINLVEVVKENWSFGNGEAQYAAAAAD